MNAELSRLEAARELLHDHPLSEVMPEMQGIAQHTLKAYGVDFTTDLHITKAMPYVKKWLWVPYENGTHIAALTPRHKVWAEAIARHTKVAYEQTPSLYLLTADSLTLISAEEAQRLVQSIPEAEYRVVDADGQTLITTSDYGAAKGMQENGQGRYLLEKHELQRGGPYYDPRVITELGEIVATHVMSW